MFLRFVHIRIPGKHTGDFANALISLHLANVCFGADSFDQEVLIRKSGERRFMGDEYDAARS